MPLTFECPHCANVTQVADEFLGRSGPCASCGETITIDAPQKPLPAKPPAKPAGSSGLTTIMLVILGVITCGGVAVALLLPAFETAGEAARRMQCGNNLKQIALALHNYHDTYKSFPPAYTVDENGNKLHSWRTLILPYLEGGSMYLHDIDYSTPWNSPQNQHLANVKAPAFFCPSNDKANPTHTSYMAIVGPGCVFEGPNAVKIRDITDGTSNTIMVVEVAKSSTHWMEPTDLDLDAMKVAINAGTGAVEFGSHHPGGAQVAMVDASVHFLAETIDLGLLRSLITRNDGNDVVNAFD